ncbi:MAG: RagB/SusD family nutrient uptake outer membrane protein [Duncaniella sp.]|nr:RagB/SusD family nutrient uptake outer membrane protein [Duncaniella sp.]
MKKFIYSIIALGGLMATSCESVIPEPNVIPEEDGLQNVADCLHYRNNIYSTLRVATTGSYVYLTDLAMDQFVGCVQNGNTNNDINSGNITSSIDAVTTLWGGYYSAIVSTNYFFEKAQPILDALPEVQDYNIVQMKRYIAEAHFARAFYYYKLVETFCPIYTEQNKDTNVGVPLRTDYNPTSHKDTYPGRSTLAATYKFIEDELDLAYEGLKYYEEELPSEAATESLVRNSSFLSTWIVRALQARTALLKGDYDNALFYANDIIDNCKIYKLVDASYTGLLVNRKYPYVQMWQNDEGTELMFRPFADVNELYIGSTGSGWLKTGDDQVNFLPVSNVLDRYYSSNDVRGRAFIGTRNLLYNGEYYNGVSTFNKWPGNTTLRTKPAENNLRNMGKPFRLSEIYLIKMECEYMKTSKDEAKALETLNYFRKQRIEKYTDESYSGADLLAQIREERTKELIGEGFRLADCRRWKVEFTRTSGLSLGNLIVNGSENVHYSSDDYRYVWPIPAKEIQVNPQLEGQQNPGY